MYERFTDRSRRVLVLARAEARSVRHAYIGTEDLLLGLLLEESGVAAKVLYSLGLSPGRARRSISSYPIPRTEVELGSPSFTPRAKTVLELALREAIQLGHAYIGTEHLLLGLIREGEGNGVRVLESRNISCGTVRVAVIKALSEQVKSVPSPAPTSPPKRETLTTRFSDSRAAHRFLEINDCGRVWDVQDHALGFLAEAGDLARSVVRAISTTTETEAVRRDLASCLWSLNAVAQESGVDLLAAFNELLDELEHTGRHEAQ
jgi:ATP-dependent Clp protease ATP-binding subunit ClpA